LNKNSFVLVGVQTKRSSEELVTDAIHHYHLHPSWAYSMYQQEIVVPLGGKKAGIYVFSRHFVA
jgi:hypothetical protein